MAEKGKYEKQIKSIKRKKVAVIIFTVVAILLTCFGVGMLTDSPLVILAALPWLLVEIFAVAIVILPMNTALDNECDPEKYFALNEGAGTRLQKMLAYPTAYFYMGAFGLSATSADAMVASKNESYRLSGLFNKARAYFFMGDREGVRAVARVYGEAMAGAKKLKGARAQAYDKLGMLINLMLALSEDDPEGIRKYRDAAEPWSASKMTACFVNYIKGLASYALGESEDAIYRFMSVKEGCPKTVLAELSAEYLEKIKENKE
jgi:hypothetical protein